MAKQNSIIPFTGKLGQQIGYERNGKYFLRGAPAIVRQTIATRNAAKRFGLASRKSRLIRHAVYPELDVHCDSSHVNRLNSLLMTTANDHMAITGFRFNQHSGIERFLAVKPMLSQNGELHIPAQEISPYSQLNALEIKVIAVRIDFGTRSITGTDTVVTTIQTGKPFGGVTIPLFVPGEGTLILTLQVRGMRHDGPSCDQRYIAADIIAILPPKAVKSFKTRTHPQHAITQLHKVSGPTHAFQEQTFVQVE